MQQSVGWVRAKESRSLWCEREEKWYQPGTHVIYVGDHARAVNVVASMLNESPTTLPLIGSIISSSAVVLVVLVISSSCSYSCRLLNPRRPCRNVSHLNSIVHELSLYMLTHCCGRQGAVSGPTPRAHSVQCGLWERTYRVHLSHRLPAWARISFTVTTVMNSSGTDDNTNRRQHAPIPTTRKGNRTRGRMPFSLRPPACWRGYNAALHYCAGMAQGREREHVARANQPARAAILALSSVARLEDVCAGFNQLRVKLRHGPTTRALIPSTSKSFIIIVSFAARVPMESINPGTAVEGETLGERAASTTGSTSADGFDVPGTGVSTCTQTERQGKSSRSAARRREAGRRQRAGRAVGKERAGRGDGELGRERRLDGGAGIHAPTLSSSQDLSQAARRRCLLLHASGRCARESLSSRA